MERKLGGVARGNLEEELILYKERLKELETAFRYNLNLIADRDEELDIVEEQLRYGIVQLERVSREKADCERVLQLLREEKTKEARLLKKKLFDRECAIKELERRNDDNVRTLEKALEDVRLQLRQERRRAEKSLIQAIRLKDNEHLEELRRAERRHAKELDEAAGEIHRLNTESRSLRKQLEEQEEIARVHHLQRICGRARTDSRETMTNRACAEIGTQTTSIDDAELAMLREQNEVLKRIIKNLKRKMGGGECKECEMVKEKVEEMNGRFMAELMQVKKEAERERTEEETVIQSLERSVTSIKNKLLKSLAGGDNIFMLEDRLNRRLEKMDQKVEEVRRRMETGAYGTTHSVATKNKCL